MSNPRLIAEDITRYYIQQLNPYNPHSKNVHRHLRRPVLAITKRILLPRDHPSVEQPINNRNKSINDNRNNVYAELEEEEDPMVVPDPPHHDTATVTTTNTTTNNASNNTKHDDCLLEDCRRRDTSQIEGMDWMDYLPPTSTSTSFDSDFSDSDTDTEARTATREEEHATDGSTSTAPVTPEPKLTVRSIARMNAFLGGVSLALPNDPILPAVADSTSVKTSTNPLFFSNIQKKLVSITETTPFFKRSTSATTTAAAATTTTNTNDHNTDQQLTNNASSLTTALSGFSPSPPRRQRRTTTHRQRSLRPYPQIDAQHLAVNLELYIRTLRRVHDRRTECVLPYEPRRNLLSKIRTLLNSLVTTAGTVGSVRSVLTRLLTALTRELLAVEYVSEETESMIRRIVLEYEHQTSFASLAFLSSPVDSADAKLKPLVVGYVEHLKAEWAVVVEGCKLEYVLRRAMKPEMRQLFKTVTFRSIGHLLEVCREQKEWLEDIRVMNVGSDFEIGCGKIESGAMDGSTKALENGSTVGGVVAATDSKIRRVPSSGVLYSFDFQTEDMTKNTKAVKQALRDLRREVLTVNGHILPPVHSLKELVNLLRETLNSRPLKLKDHCVGGKSTSSNNSGKKYNRSRRNRPTAGGGGTSSSSGNNQTTETNDNHHNGSGSGSETSRSKPTGLSDGSETETDFLSSGNEGDTDGSRKPTTREQQQTVPSTSTGDGEHPPVVLSTRASKRRHFDVDAIDVMTRRLLIAASRTGIGGDAFFVVRDLFGGEDVDVVPSEQFIPYGHMPKKISDCTIELTVRLSTIVIKCHSKFDVYPKQLVGECEPLIQLLATNTEVIQLQEVRAEAPTTTDETGDTRNANDEDTPTVLILKEKRTETTGQRIVSIRPATYEKIENWKTPS